jgi:hypothetical protein
MAERWRTVLRNRAIARPMGLQRRHITIWRSKSRWWLVTRSRRTRIGGPFIIWRQWRHTLGSSTIRRCARGQEPRPGGNHNAKVAHDILCSVSPAKLNTEVGRVFRSD